MLLSKDDKREEKGFGGAIHGSEYDAFDTD